MRADRVYRLVERRAGRLRRSPDDFDTIEIVEIATNEPVLFWDVPSRDARRLGSQLRTDLVQLEADVFLERWSSQAG